MAGTCELIRHRRLLEAVVVSLALHGVAFWAITAGRVEKQFLVAGHYFWGAMPPLNVVLGRNIGSGRRDLKASQSPMLTAGREMLADTVLPLQVPDALRGGQVSSRDAVLGDLSADGSGLRSADYLPASKLSVAPTPLGEINLPWPPEEGRLGRFCAVFTLFIDEMGAVQRMVADGPTLTPLMEETARRVFMQARFSPAMLNGYPVKAIQRIEVVFESSPEPAPENRAGG